MERREKLIESLLQRKAEHDWQGCSEILFRTLYGLPPALQLSQARFAVCRYLPIFEHRRPDIEWPSQLLDNVDLWLSQRGRSVPENPVDPDPADAAFAFAVDALLLAAAYQNDDLTLTSSCSAAVIFAINARQCVVWMAHDPEGVEMWKEQGYFPGRSVAENRPAITVAEREWEEVAARLRDEEVWGHPETVAADEIERSLDRWRDNEMLLIVPRDS